MAADYYGLLGVAPTATAEEIKKAFRARALELHPDTNPDPSAEDRFKEVALAYETLSDPDRRQRYDRYGPEAATGAGGDPFAGFGGAGLGDIFEAFFGGGGSPFGGGQTRRTGPARGADMEVAVEISFEDAVFGAARDVTLRVPVTCGACSGNGAAPGTVPKQCGECNGTGQVRRVRQSILGQMVTAGPCSSCGGRGQTVAQVCPDCRGEGRRTEERTYTVDVPAGVDAGSTLRLTGRGAAGPYGGPSGDLYVHLRVRSSDRFTREGYDLHGDLHVPMTAAALGLVAPFEALDGEEQVTIPPGTQTGRVFRVRGRGVPHVDGRGRGDLLVTVVVDTPTDLSSTQEEFLRTLAADRGENVAAPESGLLSKLRSAFK